MLHRPPVSCQALRYCTLFQSTKSVLHSTGMVIVRTIYQFTSNSVIMIKRGELFGEECCWHAVNEGRIAGWHHKDVAADLKLLERQADAALQNEASQVSES